MSEASMRTTGVATAISWLVLAGLGGAVAQEAPAVSVAAASPAAVEAGAPLDPAASALRDGVMRETADLVPETRDAIRRFYAAREYAPFWKSDGAERGEALLAALAAAPAHGLPLRRYDPVALEALFASSGEAADLGLVEVAATRSYLSFARDVSSGLLTPAQVDDEINIRPDRPEPAALLARIGAAPVAETLLQLEPASPEYRRLMAEKARMEAELLGADWGQEVPVGPTLRLGDAGPRVAAMRARLAARGYGAPTPPADPAGFDLGLDAQLKLFQSDVGLEPDGLAGAQTQTAVNDGPAARLAQVVVNLERLRWMNRDLGPRYVWANIPDFSVKVVEEGATVYSSRTVVGKAVETRTPEFSENMTYFVVNPTWHIPDSIAQRVYLPKLKTNAATLANSNMRLFTRAGTEINPGLVDFSQFNSGNFPFRIKQNPSAENALGRVKFMFPNQFAIYLHDTPLRELFGRDVRAFSNGCVRVEDPLELAYLLLEGQVADPEAAFDGWLAAKSERTINLERPIPVHLVYRTVFVDDAGAVRHRFDVYGRDARVFEALEAAGVTLPEAQG